MQTGRAFALAAAAVLALGVPLAAAPPAHAADGVASSSGSGATEAEACDAAKRAAPLAVGAALQMQGQAAQTRIVGFGACLCSRSPDADRNLATQLVAYTCIVDVQYDIVGD